MRNDRSSRAVAFLVLLASIAMPGCIELSAKPVHINSDPNQESLERLEEKNEQTNLEAFIIDHPELDAQTKKELHEGTISRREALERLKAHPKN